MSLRLVVKRRTPLLSLCRSLSSQPSSSNQQQKAKNQNANRDTRLTGRRRFYKQVGVIPTSPPWEESFLQEQQPLQESPISPGVDDSPAASGISNILPTRQQLQDVLSPRTPGSSTTANHNVDWFGVTLDGKLLKTPLGQTLALPSPLLAWAIAAEWDQQEEFLQPAQMPLMTLSCTALDQTAPDPTRIVESTLKYLPTDATCFYVDPTEDRILHRHQTKAWEQIHDVCVAKWLQDHPTKAVGTTEGFLMSRKRNGKVAGLPHSSTLLQNAQNFCQMLDAWHLTALSSVTAESKSFLVGMAVVSGTIDPQVAAKAARVEEEFQISIWGLVEGGHDYDRLNCSIQMHAAHFLVSAIGVSNDFSR